MPTRIALIHAMQPSIAPIEAAFRAHWPEVERFDLLDGSLALDRARGAPVEAFFDRFDRLAAHAIDSGATALLFTCSAFGAAIEHVARRYTPRPVMKPNEAMIAEAAATLGPVGLIASFMATLETMPREFPPAVALIPVLAEGALAALEAGDAAGHDARLVAAALRAREDGARVIAIAQFSAARAAARVAEATGLPVLTTPDSAVRALRARLGA